MAGRPRKARAEQELKGRRRGRDSGGRPLRDEPAYSAALPPPPKRLKDAGLREWKRLAPIMLEQGVLTAADWAVFLQYCDAVQRVEEIQKIMIAPAYFKDARSSSEWHKMDRALDRAEKRKTKALTELGLTPVTRSKAAVKKKAAEDDPVTKFEKGKLRAIQGGRK